MAAHCLLDHRNGVQILSWAYGAGEAASAAEQTAPGLFPDPKNHRQVGFLLRVPACFLIPKTSCLPGLTRIWNWNDWKNFLKSWNGWNGFVLRPLFRMILLFPMEYLLFLYFICPVFSPEL